MAKFKDPKNYYQRSADSANRRLNITLRAQEKVYGDFEVYTPNEAQDQRETEVAFQNMTAPTSNPNRPRALKLAYSKEAEKLVIKFRDGKWWEYNGVPVDMWNDIKSSNSTGRYLASSGLDSHDDMGPFNPDQMSPETRVLFNA